MKKPFTLGVLGGAGPRAATLFQQYFLEAWIDETHAWADHEFPRMIIDTQAFNGMTETGVYSVRSLKTSIQEGSRRLAVAGADVFVVPCFSAHGVMSSTVGEIPWLNLRRFAMGQFHGNSQNTIMFEAGAAPIDSPHGIRSFRDEWFVHFSNKPLPLFENEKDVLYKMIKNLMGNRSYRSEVEELTERLGGENLEIILGCSELSLAEWGTLKTFDALKESARGLAKHIRDVLS